MKSFSELSEQEILALAISAEEEDARIYADFAEGLKGAYPTSTKVFLEMAAEENEHRRRLIETYRSRFGEHIPLIRRQERAFFGASPQSPQPRGRPAPQLSRAFGQDVAKNRFAASAIGTLR